MYVTSCVCRKKEKKMIQYIPIPLLSKDDIKDYRYELLYSQGFYTMKEAKLYAKFRNKEETVIFIESKDCWAIVKKK